MVELQGLYRSPCRWPPRHYQNCRPIQLSVHCYLDAQKHSTLNLVTEIKQGSIRSPASGVLILSASHLVMLVHATEMLVRSLKLYREGVYLFDPQARV